MDLLTALAERRNNGKTRMKPRRVNPPGLFAPPVIGRPAAWPVCQRPSGSLGTVRERGACGSGAPKGRLEARRLAMCLPGKAFFGITSFPWPNALYHRRASLYENLAAAYAISHSVPKPGCFSANFHGEPYLIHNYEEDMSQ
jgi:hypothetical protein